MNLTSLTIRKDDLQFEVVDPGEYPAKVNVFPDIRANRYISVQLQILDEDKSVLTNLEVQFDIKKPRKLMHFLRAIGQSYSEEKDFNIIPAAW
jgi:DNA polymerase II large subunit